METFAVSTGEVDVLFVVDDSCSMAYTQALLDASVSNLLSPLWYATDLHLGVVTTDMSDPAKSGSYGFSNSRERMVSTLS